MEYIRQLRQQIGQSLVLMICAAVLSVDDDNRLLPIKRMDSGYWRPTGCVQLIREETGPDVRELVYYG